MSVETMQAFMNKVANTEALQGPAIEAWTKGGMDSVRALGKAEGFEFTEEEVIAVRDMSRPDASPALKEFGVKLGLALEARGKVGELTDDQLELVAGGAQIGGPHNPTYPKD